MDILNLLDTILGVIGRIFKCAWNHKIFSIFIIVIVIAGGSIAKSIDSNMYNASIKYEPIPYGIPTVHEDINLPYDKSAAYKESLSIGSLIEDSIGEANESASEISEVKDVLSKVEDANGHSGNLFVPSGASGVGVEDIHVYEWEKTYKWFFGQFQGNDTEVVFVMGDSALSGEIDGSSTGVLTGITVYHLA